MSERYEIVFELGKNLYCENAPVIISSGALVKDNKTDAVLALVKIKNITEKIIKAAKVSVKTFDTVGNELNEEATHEYLDLAICREGEFGAKEPIKLKNNKARACIVKVTEVIFSDNSIWSYNGEEQQAVKEPDRLIGILENSEMLKQYKIQHGENCEFVATADRDLWICSCGKINKNSETKCFKCGCTLEALQNTDMNLLKENRDKRLECEAEEAAKKAKERKMLILIGAAVLVVIIIISAINKNHQEKLDRFDEAVEMLGESYYSDDFYEGANRLLAMGDFNGSRDVVYNRAIELEGDSWISAVSLYLLLGDYNDSKDRAYNLTCENRSSDYEDAMDFFEQLGDYKDSAEKKQETPYLAGVERFEKGWYGNAYTAFNLAGEYKDSKNRAQEALLYYMALELNYNDNNVSVDNIDKSIGAEFLTGDRIKEKIAGTWIKRISSPALYETYGQDGSLSYSKYDEERTVKDDKGSWSVEDDKLMTVKKYKSYDGTVDEYKSEFKIASAGDSLLIFYDADNIIEQVMILDGSDMAEICYKEHPLD